MKRLNRHVDALRRKHADFTAAYDQANRPEKRRATQAKAEAGASEEAARPAQSVAVVPPVETAATHEAMARYSVNGNGSKATECLELVR